MELTIHGNKGYVDRVTRVALDNGIMIWQIDFADRAWEIGMSGAGGDIFDPSNKDDECHSLYVGNYSKINNCPPEDFYTELRFTEAWEMNYFTSGNKETLSVIWMPRPTLKSKFEIYKINS